MNKQMNFVKGQALTALSLIAVVLLASPQLPALAGWGWEDIDPTNPDSDVWGDTPVPDVLPNQETLENIPGSWNPAPEQGAETQIFTPSTRYNFELHNSTNYTVGVEVNGTEYRLQPGYSQAFALPRSSGSASGGSLGETYDVQLAWDFDPYNQGYQYQTFSLPFNRYDSWYEFRTDEQGYVTLY